MAIELLFSVPLAEEQILSCAPLRWKVGEVCFQSALFPYRNYYLFNRLVSVIKLKTADGLSVPLKRFLDMIFNLNDTKDEESKMSHAIVTTAIMDFKREYGKIPNSITKLLSAITTPVDINALFDELQLLLNAKFNKKKYSNQQIRQAMRIFFEYTLSVDEVVTILETIQQANIEVKKKLLAVQKTTREEKRPHRMQLYDIYLKKALSQKKQSTSSP